MLPGRDLCEGPITVPEISFHNLDQFDGNCVQGGTKLYQEGVMFYSVFPLHVFTSVVCNIKMAEKFLRLYPCSPMKSIFPQKSTLILSKIYRNCVQ